MNLDSLVLWNICQYAGKDSMNLRLVFNENDSPLNIIRRLREMTDISTLDEYEIKYLINVADTLGVCPTIIVWAILRYPDYASIEQLSYINKTYRIILNNKIIFALINRLGPYSLRNKENDLRRILHAAKIGVYRYDDTLHIDYIEDYEGVSDSYIIDLFSSLGNIEWTDSDHPLRKRYHKIIGKEIINSHIRTNNYSMTNGYVRKDYDRSILEHIMQVSFGNHFTINGTSLCTVELCNDNVYRMRVGKDYCYGGAKKSKRRALYHIRSGNAECSGVILMDRSVLQSLPKKHRKKVSDMCNIIKWRPENEVYYLNNLCERDIVNGDKLSFVEHFLKLLYNCNFCFYGKVDEFYQKNKQFIDSLFDYNVIWYTC